jgi:hypothetical protein
VSGWSGCSAGCGGGWQTRYVTQQPANGGAGCPNMSQQCNTQPCYKPISSAGPRGGFVVDIEGVSQSPAANAHMWGWWGGPNQQWRYDGANRFVVAHSGQCLDVYGGQTQNGAQVIQWPCHDGANQKWYWNGGMLRPGHAPWKCLDINGYGTGDGTKLQIWDCHGQWNQQWNY